MQVALHIKTEVLPGNKIEITEPNLIVGDSVDVLVMTEQVLPSKRESIIEMITQIRSQITSFKTSEQIDQEIQEIKNSW